MTYNSIIEIAQNQALIGRIAAAAVAEGVPDPELWAANHKWQVAAQPGWADAWLYAKENTTVNTNPNIGQRDDVINDAMILAAVQAIREAEAPA